MAYFNARPLVLGHYWVIIISFVKNTLFVYGIQILTYTIPILLVCTVALRNNVYCQVIIIFIAYKI